MARASSRRFVLALAALVSLVLAGCGSAGGITMVRSSGDHRGELQVTLASVRQAGEDTAKAMSGRFEMKVSLGESFGGDITIGGEWNDHATHQTTTASGGPGDMTSEMVTDGSTIYLKSPMLGAATSDRWYRLDGPAGMSEVAAMFGPKVSAETARLLSGAYGEVTTVGTEDVRGVETTHSRVQVDLSKVVGSEHAKTSKPFPVDVWVGSDGLLRRMALSFDSLMASVGMDMSLPEFVGGAILEFWDIGQPVDITVPTDAEPFDFSKMFGGR